MKLWTWEVVGKMIWDVATLDMGVVFGNGHCSDNVRLKLWVGTRLSQAPLSYTDTLPKTSQNFSDRCPDKPCRCQYMWDLSPLPSPGNSLASISGMYLDGKALWLSHLDPVLAKILWCKDGRLDTERGSISLPIWVQFGRLGSRVEEVWDDGMSEPWQVMIQVGLPFFCSFSTLSSLPQSLFWGCELVLNN